jgi:hypothetical protein
MPEWAAMFGASIPVPELVIRGTLTYLALLVLMRMVGQRESGGLGQTRAGRRPGRRRRECGADRRRRLDQRGVRPRRDDLVLEPRRGRGGVSLAAAGGGAQGSAATVDGRLNRRAMRREFMSEDEVLSQLRLQGRRSSRRPPCHLEPNGMISIIRRDGTDPDLSGKPGV